MSGTSADGIDAVVVEITGNGRQTTVREIASAIYSFPRGYKKFLLQNSDPDTARLDDLTRLNVLIAELFAEAAGKIAKSAGKRLSEIDLIGSHGQTVQHLPVAKVIFGRKIRATLQLGDPSVIAKRTGIVTVGNFRMGDIAVGGSGAPLVPLFDFLMLTSKTKNRLVLNIGGIANFTVLPRSCSINQVLAFDTGPGNMVIDALVQRLYHKNFDTRGIIASSGKIVPALLNRLRVHPYLTMKPPKSTGRELFGKEFVKNLLQNSRGIHSRDIIATVTEFTALSIFESYLRFVLPKISVDEILISGGGTRNPYMMDALRRYFGKMEMKTTDDVQISSDAKEAICFALLANETISGNPGNIPGSTGARKLTALGAICLP